MKTLPNRPAPSLDRVEAIKRLIGEPGDMLVLSGLSTVLSDVNLAVGDHELVFYVRGAMGCAIATGIGLAVAQPERRVVVVTGDMEVLMGAGSLSTAAVMAPRNLAVIVADNEAYGETGGQTSHTAYGVDISAMAEAAGFAKVMTVWNEDELEAARDMVRNTEGPVLATIKVSKAPYKRILPPSDGVHNCNTFRRALLGPEAIR